MSTSPVDLALALVTEAAVPGNPLDGVPIRGGRREDGDAAPVVAIAPAPASRDRAGRGYLPARVRATSWGRDPAEAESLGRAVSDALHRVGPVTRTIGGATIGLWRPFDETGPHPSRDPDTGEDSITTVYDLFMPDRALT